MISNDDRTSFKVNGEILCDGVSIAYHSENWKVSREKMRSAWNIFHLIRTKDDFPLLVRVANTRIIFINTKSGVDILPMILPLVDGEFADEIIEMSFAGFVGGNDINWNINSQINEAAGGVHLALGAGVAAAHIDFIASRAKSSL